MSRFSSGCKWPTIMVFFSVAIGAGASVAGQVPAMSRIFVSNNAEDWSAVAQPQFDSTAETTVFIVFGASSHGGFTFQGQCVFSLAATRAELFRVALPPIAVNPGQDMVRSDPFVGSWPSAAVEVTCVSDHNASWALSTTIETSTHMAGTASGGSSAGDGTVVAVPGKVPGAPVAVPTHIPVPVPVPSVVEVPVAVPGQIVIDPGGFYVDPGQVYVDPGHTVVYEEAYIPPDCSSALLAMGHSASSLIFCDGVNQSCAVALLEAGHDPSQLIFCDSISNEVCAVTLLQSGGSPTEIIFCD